MEVLSFSSAQIGGWVGSFLWPMFRIMGFFLASPIIGTQLVPVRVRLVLAVALALLVAPLLPAMPQVEGISPAALLLVAQQILIGLALGWLAHYGLARLAADVIGFALPPPSGQPFLLGLLTAATVVLRLPRIQESACRNSSRYS